MHPRTRILAIRLLEKMQRDPNYVRSLGLESAMKKRRSQ